MSLSKKEKLKVILKLISEPKFLYSLISFRSFGYLLETGWFNSLKSGTPIDDSFNPLPWFTYSAIDFIKEKLNHSLNFLEFGSGNSTLFFADRVNKVVSIEHNLDWYYKIKEKIPENVDLIRVSSKTFEEYTKPLMTMREKFDLIIVDGIFRNECLMESLKYISENGVIVLDDSERKDYVKGINFLLNNGFRQLDFSGIAAGIFFRKCTTIFYKNNSCLNI